VLIFLAILLQICFASVAIRRLHRNLDQRQFAVGA